MKELSWEIIQDFQTTIRSWREEHRRDFPRRQTTDPYKIRISETMLAQTQATRVVNYYRDRLRKFPTIEKLAQASLHDVLHARSGLGYNSRAQRVLQAAKQIVEAHSSWKTIIFPSTYRELIALPWVGDYTANAILAFAYNQDVAVIDTNIRRILIYHFNIWETTKHDKLKEYALQILPRWYARPRYNALMDYGALEITAKKTGIRPLTRQSKFEWSRRQVRAWILKTILHNENWRLDYVSIEKRFPDRTDIQMIVQSLMQEWIINSTSEWLQITRW